MNMEDGEKHPIVTSKWQSIVLALASAILGSGTLWFIWIRYNNSSDRLDLSWYNWVQLAALALMGMLCLSAALLFITGRPSGWSVFRAGLSIAPLLLISNLVVLFFRVVQNIIQGNGISFLSRLYASPLNKAILAVVIVVILLSMIKEIKKS